MQKVERLVNLIAFLLNARRPVLVEEIRDRVPGYQQEDYASFKRMFERDKEELRTLGIPLERRFTDVWEVEEGYLIPKDQYYLPDLDLTPEELAALSIVSGITVEPRAKGDQALLKLSVGTGIGTADPVAPPWLRTRLHLDEPSLPVLLEAVAARRRVKFGYKAAGRASEAQRTVDPYALIQRGAEDVRLRQGAWYLVGHDHSRKAVRHFKLQRMTTPVTFASRSAGPDFEVPEGFTTEGELDLTPEFWAGEEGVEVEVALSPRIDWWAEQSLGLTPAGAHDGWTLFGFKVVDEEGFLSWILGFGEDAIIRSPARLRRDLVARLQTLVDRPRRRAAKR